MEHWRQEFHYEHEDNKRPQQQHVQAEPASLNVDADEYEKEEQNQIPEEFQQ